MLWITLRREIVYETNFRDFHEFLSNSRSKILAKNPRVANSWIKSTRKKFFTLGSYQLTMVMSKIFYRISNNRELIFLYLNNNIWNTEKFGQKFRDSHTTSWRTNTKKIKICNTLLKLRFPKTNFREKSSDIQFAKLNPREMSKKKDSRK